MKILTMSGWGQPHDALSSVAENATHFDYASYHSVDEALVAISEAGEGCEAVIGWSLGGQLAVRAVAKGLIKPKKLVLIATPFQFVKTPELNIGMPKDLFQKFYDNYKNNPLRTMAKAWELIAHGDSNGEHIRHIMQKNDKEKVLQKNWLYWLDALNEFSCSTLDFSCFPKTMIIHGDRDGVVSCLSSVEFAKLIAGSKHIALGEEECGHAPHWHDKDTVKNHIKDFLYV